MVDNNETKISDLLDRDGVDQGITPSIENKPYTLRKLSAKDISPMVKIAKQIDVKRLKNVFSEMDLDKLRDLTKEPVEIEESEESEELEVEENKNLIIKIGSNLVIEAIPILLDALDNCLNDVNKLLASVANMKLEQLENLDLDIYFRLVYDFINKDEFAGFIKVVSKFLNVEN